MGDLASDDCPHCVPLMVISEEHFHALQKLENEALKFHQFQRGGIKKISKLLHFYVQFSYSQILFSYFTGSSITSQAIALLCSEKEGFCQHSSRGNSLPFFCIVANCSRKEEGQKPRSHLTRIFSLVSFPRDF